MKNMSFALTIEPFRTRTKFVTRRIGWWRAKPGQRVMGIEKGQGLRRGEKVQRLGAIKIETVRQEELVELLRRPEYGRVEVNREGFPDLTVEQFVDNFCRTHHCEEVAIVNRIEFSYLDWIDNRWC